MDAILLDVVCRMDELKEFLPEGLPMGMMKEFEESSRSALLVRQCFIDLRDNFRRAADPSLVVNSKGASFSPICCLLPSVAFDLARFVFCINCVMVGIYCYDTKQLMYNFVLKNSGRAIVIRKIKNLFCRLMEYNIRYDRCMIET